MFVYVIILLLCFFSNMFTYITGQMRKGDVLFQSIFNLPDNFLSGGFRTMQPDVFQLRRHHLRCLLL